MKTEITFHFDLKESEEYCRVDVKYMPDSYYFEGGCYFHYHQVFLIDDIKGDGFRLKLAQKIQDAINNCDVLFQQERELLQKYKSHLGI